MPESVSSEDAWPEPALIRMLSARDFRSVFNLARSRGMTVTQIAASTGLAEDFVHQVMAGVAKVTVPAHVESIADGLGLPAAARAALGLSPRDDDSLRMPPGFWARPDMVSALITWDVPTMLSAILQERGWTQHQLAVVLDYSQSWVSYVLGRKQSLTLEQGREFALKFGAPLHQLGKPVSELLASAESSAVFPGTGARALAPDLADDHRRVESGQLRQATLSEDGDEAVRRRGFLLSLALVMQAGTNDPVAALEAVRREFEGLPSSARHDADLSEWNEIAFEYGTTYMVAPPSDLARSLLVDFAALGEAFWRYPREADQRELHRVSALLAGFIAQTLSNLGHMSESRRWWRTARDAADRAHDSYSPLWVRGREVIHAMDQRPAPVVLQLIDQANQFTMGSQPELVLEYLGGKAQTLAMAGRREEAESTLNQLRDRFSASSSTGYSGSVLGWGEERLRNSESFTYSRLGDYDGVDNALRAAADLYKHDPANLRWPASAELDRAFCLVRGHDVGTGLSHAREVVTRLPSAHQTQHIKTKARAVLNAAPSPSPKEAAKELATYRDWLDSTFPASASR